MKYKISQTIDFLANIL